jgi:hypothetical protein
MKPLEIEWKRLNTEGHETRHYLSFGLAEIFWGTILIVCIRLAVML